MTAANLLSQLTARGVRITPDGADLRIMAPKGALTPELREALADHKPELLTLLTARSGARPAAGPSAELQALAEKCGRQMQYLQQHCDGWDDGEYFRRRDLVLENLNRLDGLLQREGRRLEECGWTTGPQGDWGRIGEVGERQPAAFQDLIAAALAEADRIAEPYPDVHLQGPEWEQLHTAMNAAYFAPDRETLAQVCREYVQLAERTVAAWKTDWGCPLDEVRARVWALVVEKGLPRLAVRPGVYTGPGEDLWRRFCHTNGRESLLSAEKALRGLSVPVDASHDASFEVGLTGRR